MGQRQSILREQEIIDMVKYKTTLTREQEKILEAGDMVVTRDVQAYRSGWYIKHKDSGVWSLLDGVGISIINRIFNDSEEMRHLFKLQELYEKIGGMVAVENTLAVSTMDPEMMRWLEELTDDLEKHLTTKKKK